MGITSGFVVHHIPVCPFSQRLEILLALKGAREAVRFQVVDITLPRPAALLAKMRGVTALPVMELPDGRILKESLVIMQFLDDALPGLRVAQADPYRRAVEQLLTRLEGEFVNAGYGFVMNQTLSRRDELAEQMLDQYARLDAFLCEHAPEGPYLFEQFGWAEAVFTPLFMRFWFLAYYEGFELPNERGFARVRAWREACITHRLAQQVSREEIIKLYYDYAQGAGNGALPAGRERSSFVFEPHWRGRPWPPRAKYGVGATDGALGLL